MAPFQAHGEDLQSILAQVMEFVDEDGASLRHIPPTVSIMPSDGGMELPTTEEDGGEPEKEADATPEDVTAISMIASVPGEEQKLFEDRASIGHTPPTISFTPSEEPQTIVA